VISVSLVDPVADALIHVKNNDMASKREAVIKPASKLIGEILKVMKENGYIDTYQFIEDGRQGMFKVVLTGKINSCRAIKPRYAVKKDDFEKYEKRYLPSRDIGVIIVSTSEGPKKNPLEAVC
jgi:small subunit ribosomal protein S8